MSVFLMSLYNWSRLLEKGEENALLANDSAANQQNITAIYDSQTPMWLEPVKLLLGNPKVGPQLCALLEASYGITGTHQ